VRDSRGKPRSKGQHHRTVAQRRMGEQPRVAAARRRPRPAQPRSGP
jgi:hypothetical protein